LVRALPEFDDPDLIVGAEGFSDAGVYRLRDDLLIVQSVDFFPPLVDDPVMFGRIAAANSFSDIYAMGGQPTTALNVVCFPDDQLPIEVLGDILRGGAEKVKEAGAVVLGGHTLRDTEIKYGLAVTGIVSPPHLLTNRTAQPGDVLVLTKSLGTGFITTAFKAGRCPESVLDAACQSMAQLNDVGRDAARAVAAHAATDITGFGLAGHACEMAVASHVTLVLEIGRLPVLPGAAKLVDARYRNRALTTNRQFVEPRMRLEGPPDKVGIELAFDAQTSGGLLISVESRRSDELVERLRAAGAVTACPVGHVTAQQACALVLRP
jgi:selenide, water dikinase